MAGFCDWYPFARGRIRQIYNPVDFQFIDELAAQEPEVQADPDKPLIVAVGRLNRQKRPDVMLEAFAKVRAEADAELWMIGDGPLRVRTEALVKQLGLQQNVRLLGFASNPHALMRQAIVLPNALIEAQGMGLPAVSTSCPYGPEEIIKPGRTGILTPVGDAAAMAAGILGLLSEPEHCRKMGQSARENIRKRFDSQIVVRQWEELILSAGE
jgi:glycosyltransferase involved in cell wall biosynthesis